MAPREIRAANLFYGIVLASSAVLLLVAGQALGQYRLWDDRELWEYAWPLFAMVGLLVLGFAGSDEARGTPWLTRLGLVAWVLYVVGTLFDQVGWSGYEPLVWLPYQVLASVHALRWFLGRRKTAWSRAAATASQ